MVSDLAIAPALHIPLEAVTSTFGIVGLRGAGKSNTARVMAERFHAARLPFIVIDPVGKWWGIRSSFDGKGPGIPIPILGGRHGDIPLERGAGRLVADLIVENRLSCVLDLFGMGGEDDSEADKIVFLTDFARRLYRRNTEPLHIFMEEADDYIPQQVPARMARLVGAFEDIVRRGRANGLGCTMITNRTQGLNKAVLEQIESLIIMRTTGPRARKAIEGWIDYHGEKRDILASLSSLHNGEAWIWSPEFLTILKRFQVPRQTTFDSAATPKISKHARPPANLADVDLGAFQQRMAETIERAKATDPKELRARVVQLQAELDHIRRDRSVQVAPPQIEQVEVSVITKDDWDALEDIRRDVAVRVEGVTEGMRAVAEDLAASAQKMTAVAERILTRVPALQPPPRKPEARAKIDPHLAIAQAFDRQVLSAVSGVKLRAGERRMLEAVARSPLQALSRVQLGLLARNKMTGGTFQSYLGSLKREGYVTERDRVIQITPGGVRAAGNPQPAVTPAETRQMWMRRLRAGERRMLEQIISKYPDGLTKNNLSILVGNEMSGGTFGSYLGTLKRNHLVREEDGRLFAADELVV